MMQVTIHDQDTRRMLTQLMKRMRRPPSAFWRKIQAHHQVKANEMFERLGRGGAHRGVTWKGFAAVTLLKYRRPSGQRYDSSSRLLQDTGHLRQSVARELRVIDRGKAATFTTPVQYASYQQAHRPFSFFTENDANVYAQYAANVIIEGRRV